MPTIYVFPNGDEFTEASLQAIFDDELDETGDVDVAGRKFSPSWLLKEVDPIYYRRSFIDWIDTQLDNGVFVEDER